MSLKVNENGAWREYNTLMHYNNGSWQDAQSLKVYENGSWVEKLSTKLVVPPDGIIYKKGYERDTFQHSVVFDIAIPLDGQKQPVHNTDNIEFGDYSLSYYNSIGIRSNSYLDFGSRNTIKVSYTYDNYVYGLSDLSLYRSETPQTYIYNNGVINPNVHVVSNLKNGYWSGGVYQTVSFQGSVHKGYYYFFVKAYGANNTSYVRLQGFEVINI